MSEIFLKTKRVLSASLVLALGLVMFPTLPIPVQADDSVDFSSVDGAKLLENTKEKKAVQLEAALTSQALGFEEKPSDFAVIKVDDAVVAIPNGSSLLSVEEEDGHLSVEWVPDLTDSSPETFADATALDIEDNAGMLHRDGSCGYYTSNNTGWMRTCFYRYRSSKTIKWEGKNQYLNILAVEATHKSKSHWIMEKARIRVNPRVSDISQVKRTPSADAKHGNCKSGSLGISYAGVGVEVGVDKCDKWDVGWSKTGQMDNTWFGDAWRSERNVALMIAVARVKPADVTWSIKSDFWAYT